MLSRCLQRRKGDKYSEGSDICGALTTHVLGTKCAGPFWVISCTFALFHYYSLFDR